MTAARRRVMVVHPVGDPQQMPFLRGISDYARQHGGWTLQFNPELLGPTLRYLKGWRGDGVIAVIRTKAEVAAARAIRVPMVNLAGWIERSGRPRVMVDQEAMGRLAAEHFLDRGFRRFAYYGERNMWYSQLRKQGFQRLLAERGFSCATLETSTQFGPRQPWYRWSETIERWLKKLAAPVGLLAVHDYAGTVVIDACLRLGLRVPEDVAVIGIGDDAITCEYCEVPLSSVARANREVGYRAAAMLARMMAGEPPPTSDEIVPPEGVVARRSTEVVVVDDPRVAGAIRFIHENADAAFGVAELAEHVGVSARALDLHFRQSLNCSPRDFLARSRIERAKRLLAQDPTIKLQQVARACGFTSPRHLRATFRRATGTTPEQFREKGKGG